VDCLSFAALSLWFLGYPEQALKRIDDAVVLARELAHPFTLAYAFCHAAMLHQLRYEAPATQQWAEACVAICVEHGFSFFSSTGSIFRGWALAIRGRETEGIAEIRQGMAMYKTTGSEINWPHNFLYLAEAYGKAGHAEEGLSALSEALGIVDKTGNAGMRQVCIGSRERWRFNPSGKLPVRESKRKLKGIFARLSKSPATRAPSHGNCARR